MARDIEILDPASIRQLSSLAEVQRLLHEATLEERAIDAELESLMERRSEVERRVLGLQESSAEALELLEVEADSLAQQTARAASLGAGVSASVRSLDSAARRVAAALRVVEARLARARASEGIRAALERERLEEACECVAGYLQAEAAVTRDRVEGTGSGKRAEGEQSTKDGRLRKESHAPPSSPDPETLALESGRQEVARAVEARVAACAARHDHGGLLQSARLFASLHLAERGALAVARYAAGLVSERAEAGQQELALAAAAARQGASAPDYLGALTDVFRDGAAAVEEHAAYLKEAFGAQEAVAALCEIHRAVDAAAAGVLAHYSEARALPAVVEELARGGGRGEGGAGASADGGARLGALLDPPSAEGGGASAAAALEPRAAEVWVEQVLALTTRGEEYCAFFAARLAQAASPAELSREQEAAVSGGALARTLRQLSGCYLALETYYLDAGVHKALRLDALPPAALVSSCVDDAFFVLRRAGQRALAAAHVPSAVAVLGHAHALLGGALRSHLADRLVGAPARLARALDGEEGRAQPAASGPSALALACAPLNSADVAAHYALTLQRQLEAAARAAPFFAPADRDRVLGALGDLGRCQADLRALCARGAEAAASALAPRLRPALDALGAAAYVGGGAEEGSRAQAWAGLAAAELARLHAALSPALTPDLAEGVTLSVLDRTLARAEALLLAQTFDQMGGLQLERDVRSLASAVGELSQRSVRERFARLAQMAMVLGLESAAEVAELLAEGGGGVWRLSQGEVRSLLSRRADF